MGVAAAAWYLVARSEPVAPREASEVVAFAPQESTGWSDQPVAERLTPAVGIQTAIPETVGYDERTAVFTIEQGGFRVRVMGQPTSNQRDEGRVLQQLPRGGSTRRVGWTVTIFVGTRR